MFLGDYPFHWAFQAPNKGLHLPCIGQATPAANWQPLLHTEQAETHCWPSPTLGGKEGIFLPFALFSWGPLSQAIFLVVPSLIVVDILN